MLRPYAAKFNVTAKDEVLDEDSVSPIHWPLTILFLLTLSGVVAFAVRWALFPGDHPVLAVVGGWAVFNFIITATAWGAVAERSQLRVSPRVEMKVDARIAGATAGQETRGYVIDASTSGARIMIPSEHVGVMGAALTANNAISFTPSFPGAPQLEHAIRGRVRNVSLEPNGTIVGVTFASDQPAIAREAVAFLIFGDSDTWAAMRRSRQRALGLVPGFAYVLYLFAKAFPATLIQFAKEPARRANAAARVQPAKKAPHILAFGVDIDTENRRRALNVVSTTSDRADAMDAADHTLRRDVPRPGPQDPSGSQQELTARAS